MRFTNNKTGSREFTELMGYGRLIFLRRADYSEPLMNLEEEQDARKNEAASQDLRPKEAFHGYNITDDQALEHARLGVRDELYERYRRWFPNTPLQDLPVDERTNNLVRSRAAEIVSQRRLREGPLGSRWRAGRGFFQNLRSLFRTGQGLIREEVRDRYGENLTNQNRRLFLGRNAWNWLSNAQQVQVNAQFALMGVPVPPAAGGFNGNEIRMANATPQQHEQLMTALPFLSNMAGTGTPAGRHRGPLFPSSRDIEPVNPYMTLVEYVDSAGAERMKGLSTTVFDAQRLQRRLDWLERNHNGVFMTLVTEVLEDHELYSVENSADAQALLSWIEWRLETHGINNFQQDLIGIRDNLPQQTASTNGAEQTEEQRQIERAQEIARNVAQMHEQLIDKYIEAQSLGNELYNARATFFHTAQPAAPMGGGASPVDTGYRDVRQRAADLEKEQRTMKNDITKLERKFGPLSREMLDMINTASPIPATAGPNDPANLINFNNSVFGIPRGGPPPESTDDQLFGAITYPPGAAPAITDPKVARPAGVGASVFMNGINNIGANATNPAMMKALAGEIRSQAEERFRPRQRVNCKQLLFLFMDGDLFRRGMTQPEERYATAFIESDKLIRRAKHKQIFRQTNQENLEYRAGSTLGSNRLDRLRKRLLAGLTGGILDNFLGRRVFGLQDAVNHITGTDGELAMFHNMRPDMTLAELRDLIDRNGGISTQKLEEFATKLQEIYIGFEMQNSEGRVEYNDSEAVDMEILIEKISDVQSELRSRRFMEQIRGTSGNKAELVLQRIREEGQANDQEERSIIEQISNKAAQWKQWFSRRVLGREFNDKYAEARKFIAEQGMNSRQANNYLSAKGLTTAAGVLATTYTAREWSQRGKNAARWTVGSGGTGLGLLWNKAGSPVLKYGVKKPLEWAIWRPAKWTAQTAGKMVAFPFVLAGSIGKGYWNWATGKK